MPKTIPLFESMVMVLLSNKVPSSNKRYEALVEPGTDPKSVSLPIDTVPPLMFKPL